MKLKEAIENLKADLLRPGSVDKLDFQDAEQLGIETMERLMQNRQSAWPAKLHSLPGETED